MVKQHKRFVQNQVQTHFSQKEKKKYPLWKIAMATFFQVPDETLANLPVFMVLAGIGFGWKIIPLYKYIRRKRLYCIVRKCL